MTGCSRPVVELVGPVDPVLALVVDAERRSPPACAARQASATAPAPMSVPRLPVVWPAPSSRRRVDDHPDPLGVDAQLLDGDLEGDGVDALAHLGPAVAHLDGAVVLEAHDRLGDLLEAVAEARVLQAEADADGLARPPTAAS